MEVTTDSTPKAWAVKKRCGITKTEKIGERLSGAKTQAFKNPSLLAWY